MKVDGGRLWESLMDLATIGGTPKGGVSRLALTDLDRQARDRVIGWLKEAGCSVEIDGVGNIFAIRPGRDAKAPVVLTGSHVDTQPSGGKFDGQYGVLAGLEVLRTLNDSKTATRKPVGVAIWTNEEGSRFVPVMGGSGAFAGVFTPDEIWSQRDIDGVSFGEALERIGYKGPLPVGGRPLDAYFEAHIEQGPILERDAKTIGLVTGVLGLRWYDCTWTGQDAHAGPTPMESRHDALRAAAQLVEAVNELARRYAPHGRGTVGFMQVKPNSRNVIPGLVKMSVDLRHPDDAMLAAMDGELKVAAHGIAAQLDVQCELRQVASFAACRFNAQCVELVRAGAAAFGYAHEEIVSGAGHDAVYVARAAPTAMIFIPCEGGISHNELEAARPEHVEAGANVLLHAVLARAGVTA
ncbi:MAG TPA: Zn-dependent hydrolase [Usitatibacter sp.]|nr:Zn-dependent hydrolase [Usitatibacter sp.]